MNRKIVRIIHWDDADPEGRRHTRFFSNVDSVSWFEVDDNGNMVPDTNEMVIDWYEDQALNKERAKAAQQK